MGSFSFYLIYKIPYKDFLIGILNTTVFPLYFVYALAFLIHVTGLSPSGFGLISAGNRLTGFSYESNILGSETLFWLATIYQKRDRLLKWKRLSFASLSIVIVGTGTRAAIVSLIFLGIYHYIYKLRSSKNSGISIFFVVVSLMLLASSTIIGVIQQGNTSNNIGRLTNGFDLNSGTGAYRLAVYKIAISDIKSASGSVQLFGHGTNSFAQLHPLDISKVETGYLSDLWLEVLYDSGLFGLISFILLLILAIRRTRKSEKNSIVFWISLIFCATTTSMLWFSYTWVIIAFLAFNDDPPEILNSKIIK